MDRMRKSKFSEEQTAKAGPSVAGGLSSTRSYGMATTQGEQMKAIVFDRYGPPEVLQLRDVPKPVPGDDEVLIQVHATTVPAEDPMIRGFTFGPLFWIPLRIAFGILRPKKRILGSEFSGEVEAVGKLVTGFERGDQVLGVDIKDLGCYAEYKCLPESGVLLPKSPNVSFEAAAPVCGALAAWNLLRDKVPVQCGQRVLIYGASGNIGTAAVQIAKYFGAEVTGVCSTANLDLVRSLGADHVVDYTKEDFTRRGETYDIIFDVVSKSSFLRCRRSLTRSGAYISALPTPSILLQMLWTTRFGGRRAVFSATGLRPVSIRLALLKELTALVETGKIRTVIDRSYPLEEIRAAHRYVAKGHKKGSVIINVVAP